MYRRNEITGLEAFGAVILLILLVLVSPFVGFCCGWLTGWIIKVTFGATMVKGLGLIGLNIAKESLPLLCGTLGVIGSFFKNTTVNRKND